MIFIAYKSPVCFFFAKKTQPYAPYPSGLMNSKSFRPTPCSCVTFSALMFTTSESELYLKLDQEVPSIYRDHVELERLLLGRLLLDHGLARILWVENAFLLLSLEIQLRRDHRLHFFLAGGTRFGGTKILNPNLGR